MDFKIRSAEQLARLLDNEFSLFGIRFGLDALFGLIPVAGDTIALLLSLWIVFIGWQIDMPINQKLRMLANVLIDYVIDFIPIVGDLSWIIYKPNIRNIEIIRQYAPTNVIQGQIVSNQPVVGR